MDINSINLIKKYNLVIFFVAVLNFLSIVAMEGQSSVQQLDDAIWKKDAMLALSKRYIGYNESGRQTKIELDLYFKFNDIHRFPFGAGIHKLKEELESKKVVFDSIICVIEQNTYASNPELLLPASYYIFKDGKMLNLLLFDADDLSIYEKDWTIVEYEEIYTKSITMTDNVFNSLLVFTKIYPDWRFEISKLVINSY